VKFRFSLLLTISSLLEVLQSYHTLLITLLALFTYSSFDNRYQWFAKYLKRYEGMPETWKSVFRTIQNSQRLSLEFKFTCCRFINGPILKYKMCYIKEAEFIFQRYNNPQHGITIKLWHVRTYYVAKSISDTGVHHSVPPSRWLLMARPSQGNRWAVIILWGYGPSALHALYVPARGLASSAWPLIRCCTMGVQYSKSLKLFKPHW
jgi:hypothetical protein